MAQDLKIDIVATDKTGAAFRSVQTGLGGIQTSANALLTKISALTGALAAIGIGTHIQSIINTADELAKMSQKTGIAVDELSALANSADLAGVSHDSLGSALNKFNKYISEAASGSKDQLATINALGISVLDVNGKIKPTSDLLKEVADKFASSSDGANKAAFAMALFGKAGADLIPFLNQGSKGLTQFGSSISTEFANQAEIFNDNITKMGQRISRFVSTEGESLITWINKIVSGSLDNGWKGAFGISQMDEAYYNMKKLEKELDALIERSKIGGASGYLFFPEIKEKLAQYEQAKKIFQDIRDSQKKDSGEKPKGEMPGLPASNVEKEKDNLKELAAAYQQISDEIFKLTNGERELAIFQFARKGASVEEIAIYTEQIDKLAQLKEAQKATEEEAKQYADQDKLNRQARNDLLEKGKQLYDETRTPLEKLNIAEAELLRLLELGIIDFDVYSRAIFQANEAMDKMTEDSKDNFGELEAAIRGWGNEFTNIIATAVTTGKLSFKDLANSVINDLLRMSIQKNITAPLFGTSDKPGLLSIGIDKLMGARAMGGPVTSGQPYLVGEQGPEIFMPSNSGTIIPNGQGGGGVVVNQTIQVTTGVQQTVRAEVMNMLPQIANAAKSAVAEAKLRGGSFAAAMR